MKNRALLLALASVLLLFPAACAVKHLPATEYGNPGARHRVLIAAEKSDFKSAVLQKTVDGLTRDDTYVKVIGLADLDPEAAGGYDAVLVMNTLMAWTLEPEARSFLKDQDLKAKTVLLTTAGDADWETGTKDVDAITAASETTDADNTASQVLEKIREKLGP